MIRSDPNEVGLITLIGKQTEQKQKHTNEKLHSKYIGRTAKNFVLAKDPRASVQSLLPKTRQNHFSLYKPKQRRDEKKCCANVVLAWGETKPNAFGCTFGLHYV